MKKTILIVLCVPLMFSCGMDEEKNQEENNTNIMAKKIAKTNIYHSDTIIDNYAWMRLSDKQKESDKPDIQTQDVIKYLNLENDYLKEEMHDTKLFQDNLYKEFVSRVKQDDESVPLSYNGYKYYSKYEKGEDYPCHYRKKNTNSSNEELILNLPVMSKGSEYFSLGDKSISENNQFLAYSIDLLSRREYTIYIKDLKTGKLLEDKIKNTSGSITWANDNKTIFYTKKDEVTLRSNRVYKHKMGSPQSEDELVYEEKDETFGTFVYKTKSRAYIIIGSYSTLSNEYTFVDANTPDAEFSMIQPRTEKLEYSVAHYKEHFYILTNHEAKNFRLMKANVGNCGLESWEEVIPHRENVMLEGVELFSNFLVLDERENGLTNLRIKPWKGDAEYYLPFKDAAYSAGVGANLDFDTDWLRYGYTSMTTPSSTLEWNMKTKEQKLLKQILL